MRRMSRINRPIGLLRRQPSARIPSKYLCLACKHQTTPLSTSSLRAAPSSDKTPFTEKVRQRIWGTDQPPGLDDPYGDGSVFDKTKKGPRKQKAKAREQEPVVAPLKVEETATDETRHYPKKKQAITWDDLEWVGGGPVWHPEENFEGFLPPDAETGPEQITAALHRAMVEAFALRQAGKSLHELSTHFPEIDGYDDWTDDVQITPSSTGATIQMPEHNSLQEVMESFVASDVNEEIQEPEPTESQEDVDADRSEVHPLKLGETPSTEPIPEPAEPIEAEEQSSEDQELKYEMVGRTFEEVINSWDPSWLEISLENPEVKFAVSHSAIGH